MIEDYCLYWINRYFWPNPSRLSKTSFFAFLLIMAVIVDNHTTNKMAQEAGGLAGLPGVQSFCKHNRSIVYAIYLIHKKVSNEVYDGNSDYRHRLSAHC